MSLSCLFQENKSLQTELRQVKGVVNDLMSQLGEKQQNPPPHSGVPVKVDPIHRFVESETKHQGGRQDNTAHPPAAEESGAWNGVASLGDAPHLDARDLMTIGAYIHTYLPTYIIHT